MYSHFFKKLLISCGEIVGLAPCTAKGVKSAIPSIIKRGERVEVMIHSPVEVYGVAGWTRAPLVREL